MLASELCLYDDKTVDKVITKNTRKQCWILSLLWKNKLKKRLLNQRYPASTTHILQKFSNFWCKTKFFVAFHLYLASNITLVLRFMISSKFYYVQTAKVKYKDASCSKIKFCPQWGVFTHFSNSNFLVISPYKWNQRTNLEYVHI